MWPSKRTCLHVQHACREQRGWEETYSVEYPIVIIIRTIPLLLQDNTIGSHLAHIRAVSLPVLVIVLIQKQIPIRSLSFHISHLHVHFFLNAKYKIIPSSTKKATAVIIVNISSRF